MKTRLAIRFTGRVQGVGFRYTAFHIANSLGLTGWVYNEWDGSVLMELQGEAFSVYSMIAKLKDAPFIEIDNVEKEERPLDESERSFDIR